MKFKILLLIVGNICMCKHIGKLKLRFSKDPVNYI